MNEVKIQETVRVRLQGGRGAGSTLAKLFLVRSWSAFKRGSCLSPRLILWPPDDSGDPPVPTNIFFFFFKVLFSNQES